MTPTHPTSANRFPPPHRAPGPLDELAGGSSEEDLPVGSPEQRRYQRALDGWMATRVRKQSRHWRRR